MLFCKEENKIFTMHHGIQKILILEKSVLLAEGLSSVITKNCEKPYRILHSADEQHFRKDMEEIFPDIVIASPELFQKQHIWFEHINVIKVGLIYGYVHPSVLAGLDTKIYLEDPLETIVEQICALNVHGNHHHHNTKPLTKREKEVISLLAKGLSNKDVAEKLFLSPHTVNAHRKNIMKKLGINTVSGLTMFAVIHGFVQVD